MDVAVLWDIRMDPGFQGFGTRRALFESAAVWAREQDCVHLQAETQNVSACRFYARMGCRLRTFDRFAYWADAALRDEVMLVWVLDL